RVSKIRRQHSTRNLETAVNPAFGSAGTYSFYFLPSVDLVLHHRLYKPPSWQHGLACFIKLSSPTALAFSQPLAVRDACALRNVAHRINRAADPTECHQTKPSIGNRIK
uniref:Uncharacterized protein n=1 Tax=Anopheles quadriannulatus TaxID=34691 RepID=A0A182XG68_ANOQN